MVYVCGRYDQESNVMFVRHSLMQNVILATNVGLLCRAYGC